MAARKKKAPAKKSAASSGRTGAAKKKSATKKAPAKPAASGGKAPAKKASAKKAPARKKAAASAPEETARPEGATSPTMTEARRETPAPAGGGVSSLAVNLGHVFALRPRVETAFRPDDLRAARQQLQDERYETLEEAARAVAAKALELTRESGRRR